MGAAFQLCIPQSLEGAITHYRHPVVWEVTGSTGGEYINGSRSSIHRWVFLGFLSPSCQVIGDNCQDMKPGNGAPITDHWDPSSPYDVYIQAPVPHIACSVGGVHALCCSCLQCGRSTCWGCSCFQCVKSTCWDL